MESLRSFAQSRPRARSIPRANQEAYDIIRQGSSLPSSEINLAMIADFVQNIRVARSLQQAVDVLHGLILQLGCRRLVYARGRMIHPDRPLAAPPVIIERDLPHNWRTGYAQRGHFDPYFRLPCTAMAGMEWASIQADSENLSKPVQAFIEYAHEIGLHKGYTVPVQTSPNQYALISAIDCIDEDKEISESLKIILPLIAHYFVNESIARFDFHKKDTFSLSKREEECLFWFAHGKSVQDIATILDISPETVPVYFKRVTSKLNAANRTNALAKAINLGLIEMSAFSEDLGPLPDGLSGAP